MKIKISKSQWIDAGKKAGWIKMAQSQMRQSYDPKLVTDEAKVLWFKINDYLIMADDPKFETIRAFRNRIERVKDPTDREELKKYFESEFSGSHTIQTGAWGYYK